ncbi:MAG: VIT and VWA domain-containing protein [Candidatus Omnitrophota bacterium]
MKTQQTKLRRGGGLAAGIMFLILTGSAQAAGLLTPKDSGLPELQIKDHQVHVVVEDGYAITTVDQTFYNPNGQDLEAIYSFPVPKKGAVSEFTMWIDGKPISGEVLEKKKAREVYEEQKSKNNDAGLTEKNDYKTFEMSVSPVRANQQTKVRISYIQPAHVDTGIGRYLYPLEEGGVDDAALAFWKTNDKVSGTFSFDLVLKSAYPVADVRLPNHPQAQITNNNGEWMIHLDNHLIRSSSAQADPSTLTINQSNSGDDTPLPTVQADPNFRLDTDIAIYYRHAENLPGSVDLVAFKEATSQRGTFMLTITPGMDLQPIVEGRDWVFVLDISGSMQGKYATLAEGVSRALKTMKPEDRFRIVLFNDTARELTNGFVTATAQNVNHYINAVSTVSPNNGTNLYGGLQLGLKSLDSDRTSSILLVTDGVANVGVTEQKGFIEMIKKYDIRLFTYIMGNSANEPLLNALTRETNGFAINVSNSDDIIGKILEAQSKVNFQALHGAQVKINGVKTADINPSSIGSVYRGQQLIVFGHYFGSGPAEVTLQGKISGLDKSYSTRFNFPEAATTNPEIERLWAYASIEELIQQMDDFGETADKKQSVVDLGVEYSLVTDYTSMIVLKEEVYQELGIDRRNQQRLKTEYQARQVRSAQPAQSYRVDTQQPMFSGNQPTYAGGGGAFGPGAVLLFSPLLWGLRKRKEDKV